MKGTRLNAPIIGNPGTTFTNNISGQTTYSVMDYATSVDIMVTFENSASEYTGNYTAPSWVDDLTADHFAHMIHSQSGWDEALPALAHQRKAGMLFVTDDIMSNPYDQPPSYWASQIDALSRHNAAQVPEPSTPLLLIRANSRVCQTGLRY